jgi:hypothetical protein
MTNFRLIGAVALSLVLATPAMAMHRGYRHHYGYHSRSAYGAFALDRGYSYVPRGISGDFDRRNTFN